MPETLGVRSRPTSPGGNSILLLPIASAKDLIGLDLLTGLVNSTCIVAFPNFGGSPLMAPVVEIERTAS